MKLNMLDVSDYCNLQTLELVECMLAPTTCKTPPTSSISTNSYLIPTKASEHMFGYS